MTVYVLQEMGRNIRSAELSTFCDDDYLLLIGDPAIIALAGAIASEMNRGKFKVLKWDRDEKKYYDLEIDLRG